VMNDEIEYKGYYINIKDVNLGNQWYYTYVVQNCDTNKVVIKHDEDRGYPDTESEAISWAKQDIDEMIESQEYQATKKHFEVALRILDDQLCSILIPKYKGHKLSELEKQKCEEMKDAIRFFKKYIEENF